MLESLPWSHSLVLGPGCFQAPHGVRWILRRHVSSLKYGIEEWWILALSHYSLRFRGPTEFKVYKLDMQDLCSVSGSSARIQFIENRNGRFQSESWSSLRLPRTVLNYRRGLIQLVVLKGIISLSEKSLYTNN